MQKLIPYVEKIAEMIKKEEGKRKKLAVKLRGMNSDLKLICRTDSNPLENKKVIGVDGGLAKKSLHGIDCILVRAVGVCFRYKNGRVLDVDYFPSKIPAPEPLVLEALSDLDWAYSAAIARQISEVKTAAMCMERFKPDVLLMHGSIIPYYSDKPSRSSSVYEAYLNMIAEYKKLFHNAQKGNTILAGVIEDSRSTAFCNLIIDRLKYEAGEESGDLLNKTRDTNLLYLMLKKGERSDVFRYAKSPKDHPVLRDLPDFNEKIYSFYLKTAEFDRPVRVDFFRKGCVEDDLASVILAVSGHHSSYGLPAPLIEADNVAKLSDSEIENFYSHILSLTGNIPSVFKLRREQRPF